MRARLKVYFSELAREAAEPFPQQLLLNVEAAPSEKDGHRFTRIRHLDYFIRNSGIPRLPAEEASLLLAKLLHRPFRERCLYASQSQLKDAIG